MGLGQRDPWSWPPRSCDQASGEGLVQAVPVEVTANEHQTVRPACVSPGSIWLPVKEHMNALEDVALLLTGDRQDAFHAKDVDTLLGEKLAQPLVEPLRVHLPGQLDADRGDRCVMEMLALIQEGRIQAQG